jgi:hypothetical protein
MTLACLGLMACQGPLPIVTYDDDGGNCREQAGGGGERCSIDRIHLSVDHHVDILFVVDDTASMARRQARLATGIDTLIEALESDQIDGDYRIGITTTDNGNPWCPAQTPAMGALQLSSCRGRLDDFILNAQQLPTDHSDIGCTDFCAHEADQLDAAMLPTNTDLDPNLKVRPWIESSAGKTNLPAGISPADAFRCFAPQGLLGCGYESPLESMYKAVRRSQDANDEAYGFFREDGIHVIVILSDEVDCSYNPDYIEIFDLEGSGVFWSNPDWPTSGLCWNAGVACEGPPTDYDQCNAVDKRTDGGVTGMPNLAVLHPLERYADLLQDQENESKMLDPDRELSVFLIAGVPEGYAQGSAEIPYAQSEDTTFQEDFGIAPGCTAPVENDEDEFGLPPVRMRELSETFVDGGVYSVCRDDYTAAFERIADVIGEQARPGCFHACVQDVDEDAPGVQTECEVRQEVPGEPQFLIPACDVLDGEPILPTAEDDVCFVARGDATQSGDPLDDLSDLCVEDGFNLEFDLVRRAGVPAPGGTAVTATCQLAEFPTVDCPNLGG